MDLPLPSPAAQIFMCAVGTRLYIKTNRAAAWSPSIKLSSASLIKCKVVFTASPSPSLVHMVGRVKKQNLCTGRDARVPYRMVHFCGKALLISIWKIVSSNADPKISVVIS
jgi:hypothetical protein